MKTHPVTSLLVNAMNKATARYVNIPANRRKCIDWRRYNALLEHGRGTANDFPAFLDILDYIREKMPYDDNEFLQIWYDELDGVQVQIQGEVIIDRLDKASPQELAKLSKTLVKYIKRNVH